MCFVYTCFTIKLSSLDYDPKFFKNMDKIMLRIKFKQTLKLFLISIFRRKNKKCQEKITTLITYQVQAILQEVGRTGFFLSNEQQQYFFSSYLQSPFYLSVCDSTKTSPSDTFSLLICHVFSLRFSFSSDFDHLSVSNLEKW